MKKSFELQNIDDFIHDYNVVFPNAGNLIRISGPGQENPDTKCSLGSKTIGIEATVVLAPENHPNQQQSEKSNTADVFYNPWPAINELVRLARKKSQNDYKEAGIDEVWLLISGGSYISLHDLEDRLRSESFTSKFGHIFIHKGTGELLVEIKPKSN